MDIHIVCILGVSGSFKNGEGSGMFSSTIRRGVLGIFPLQSWGILG